MENEKVKSKAKKTIRALKSKAEAGDIKATFQLANHYRDGLYVDINEDISQEYYKKCNDLVNRFDFKLDNIKLFGFKRFKEITVSFSKSNLTILVGNNGSGKTTILSSLAKSLRWFVSNIEKQDKPGYYIKQLEINNEPTIEYASIITTLQMTPHTTFDIELSESKDINKVKRNNRVIDFKLLSSLFRYANDKNKDLNLPIIVFYPTIRSITDIGTSREISDIADHYNWEKIDGYKDGLDKPINIDIFLGWFKRFDDIKNQISSEDVEKENEIKKLEAELNSDIVIQLEKHLKTTGEENKFLSDFKKAREKRLKELLIKVNKPNNRSRDVLKHVINALSIMMPQFKNIRIERITGVRMLLEKDGITLNVSQLSEGEQVLMALVGDIARRMVMLNPARERPLEGQGIILIDEIDLHLHPEWQQLVIPRLQSVFCNIQFIITTHSPQVLTTVPVKSIRKLSSEIDSETGEIINKVEYPDYQTMGLSNSSAISELQDTPSVPDIEQADWLSLYRSQIEQGKDLNEESSIKLKTKLENHFGTNHPVMIDLQRLIRLQVRKEKLKGSKLNA